MRELRTGSLADDFIASIICNSSRRREKAISFVSVAEIAFARSVTSHPRHITHREESDTAPGSIFLLSREEVTGAVKEIEKARDNSITRGIKDRPPGHWLIYNAALLVELSPTIAFI